jgi:hypothetical protein
MLQVVEIRVREHDFLAGCGETARSVCSPGPFQRFLAKRENALNGNIPNAVRITPDVSPGSSVCAIRLILDKD